MAPRLSMHAPDLADFEEELNLAGQGPIGNKVGVFLQNPPAVHNLPNLVGEIPEDLENHPDRLRFYTKGLLSFSGLAEFSLYLIITNGVSEQLVACFLVNAPLAFLCHLLVRKLQKELPNGLGGHQENHEHGD